MFVQLSDGVRLFYDVVGSQLGISGASTNERQALLLLHGGPGLDHMVFRPAFDPLSKKFQLIYLDQRGCGRSDDGPRDKWHLNQWADDVAEAIERIGIEKPLVLGTSFGGFVAQRFASRYPDALSGLILMSTAPRVDLNATINGLGELGGKNARRAAADFFSDAAVPGVVETYFDTCLSLYTMGEIDLEVMGRVIQRPDVMMHFFDKDGEFKDVNVSADLQDIKVPTLVVHGADDPVFPIYLARETFDLLPDIGRVPGMRKELVEIDSCGHLSEQDAPEKIIAAITHFFSPS